jgi:hypothetical protein
MMLSKLGPTMIPVSIFSIIVILVQVFNKSSIVVFLRKHRNFKSRQDFFYSNVKPTKTC